MKVLITGTSSGIGLAITQKFLGEGHNVIGMDILPSPIQHKNYTHLICDISDESLPEIENVEILINNAGIQTQSAKDIQVNLVATINITEKYAFQNCIRSVVNIASASGTTGAEFPEYAASKGGLISYTKNVAQRIAKFGATCNSISPGGVITDLNKHILDDPTMWQEVLAETTLGKWASAEEIADWTYFVSVINKSMTAQDILIDNGESTKFNFVW